MATRRELRDTSDYRDILLAQAAGIIELYAPELRVNERLAETVSVSQSILRTKSKAASVPEAMNNEQEREANYFAMCLLMPRDLLMADLKKLGTIDVCDDPNIRALAKKYGVGEQMMTVRIANLLAGR